MANGSKKRILDHLLANLGRVIESRELLRASGNATNFARRARELRAEGWEILTHRDRAELKPGQYLLETANRVPVLPTTISKEARAFVLERNGYTCKMCGAGAGDPDPFNASRTIRLTMGHIIDKSKGGDDSPSNLRAVCTNCNEGLQNTAPPKPMRIDLMTTIRRAREDDQLAVLDWLEKKFAKLRPKSNS